MGVGGGLMVEVDKGQITRGPIGLGIIADELGRNGWRQGATLLWCLGPCPSVTDRIPPHIRSLGGKGWGTTKAAEA